MELFSLHDIFADLELTETPFFVNQLLKFASSKQSSFACFFLLFICSHLRES